jgi:hypothetical protein
MRLRQGIWLWFFLWSDRGVSADTVNFKGKVYLLYALFL